MTTWPTLEARLDALAAGGRVIPVWWRDDDAGRDQPALGDLLALAERHVWPVALAVVPAWLTPAAEARIAASDHATVIQHGYAHADHAAAGARSIELGGRDPALVLGELERGRVALSEAFGARFLAVLAPPWNRIDAALVPRLAAVGLCGLSTHGRRAPTLAAPGLPQFDTHLDPIDWRGTRRFVGETAALARLMDLLDADAPIGLLTHHLNLDGAGWRFLDRLLTLLMAHPATAPCAVAELFLTPLDGRRSRPPCLETVR